MSGLGTAQPGPGRRRAGRWAAALISAGLCLPAPRAGAETAKAPLVRLSDLAPGIAQDIRYARAFNFTGGPVPGYEAGECLLTPMTAAALIRVEGRLAEQGYGLVVFDCYRPLRAVAFFADWAAEPPAPDNRPEGAEPALDTPPEVPEPAEVFFPGLSRSDLIPQGYIARQSGHSQGHTVDVGLRRKGEAPALPEFAIASDCTAPFAQRTAETGLDLGTAFDCFSPLSAKGAAVGAEATRNRRLLRQAMEREGFRNYAPEWWHFRNMADPTETPLDLPVR